VLHHSIGSTIIDDLIKDSRQQFILIYHNITPPEFFRYVNPAWAFMMQQGQEQLLALPARTGLALADSAYNELDLQASGFQETGVLPITLDETQYRWPLNEALAEEYAGRGTAAALCRPDRTQQAARRPGEIAVLLSAHRAHGAAGPGGR
jgi:L-malate glycosyltransferase